MENKPSQQHHHICAVPIEDNMATTANAAAMKQILHYLDNVQLPFIQNARWEVPHVTSRTNEDLIFAEPIPLHDVDDDSIEDQVPLQVMALLAESLGDGEATNEGATTATAVLAAAPKVSNPFEDGDCLQFEGKSFFFVADDYSQSEQYQP
jgi:hypothetical protein